MVSTVLTTWKNSYLSYPNCFSPPFFPWIPSYAFTHAAPEILHFFWQTPLAPVWACAAMHNPTAGRAGSMETKPLRFPAWLTNKWQQDSPGPSHLDVDLLWSSPVSLGSLSFPNDLNVGLQLPPNGKQAKCKPKQQTAADRKKDKLECPLLSNEDINLFGGVGGQGKKGL